MLEATMSDGAMRIWSEAVGENVFVYQYSDGDLLIMRQMGPDADRSLLTLEQTRCFIRQSNRGYPFQGSLSLGTNDLDEHVWMSPWRDGAKLTHKDTEMLFLKYEVEGIFEALKKRSPHDYPPLS